MTKTCKECIYWRLLEKYNRGVCVAPLPQWVIKKGMVGSGFIHSELSAQNCVCFQERKKQ